MSNKLSTKKSLTVKPKYQQVLEMIEKDLQDGEFAYGTRLPTTKALGRKYGVSSGIVSKAIAPLIRKGLLQAKVGSGIYSRVEKTPVPAERGLHFQQFMNSGLGRKQLLIWIEDPQPWQVEFWTRQVQAIQKKYPDIELKVRHGFKVLELEEQPDMIISTTSFFNNTGFDFSEVMDQSVIDKFYPDLYEGMLFAPDTAPWKKQHVMFPVFFAYPLIACRQQNWRDDFPDATGIFNIVHKIQESKIFPSIYTMWTSLTTFIASGLKWYEEANGGFSLQGKDHWEKNMSTLKEFYRKGIVNWVVYYPNPVSPDNIQKHFSPQWGFMEASPQTALRSQNDPSLRFFMLPFRETFPYTPVCGFIMKNTLYPEECLRVIGHLLTENVQREYLSSGLGFPISEQVLAESPFASNIQRLRESKKVLYYPPDKLIHIMTNEFIFSELYHYLNSSANYDFFSRIQAKVAYFLQNVNRAYIANDNTKWLLSKYISSQKKLNNETSKDNSMEVALMS